MIDRSNTFSSQLTIVYLLSHHIFFGKILQREEYVQNLNNGVQWKKYYTAWKETWIVTQDSFSKELNNFIQEIHLSTL